MEGDDWWNTVPARIVLSAEDWDEFMRVMQAPTKPTEAAIRGAKQLRELYGDKPRNDIK